MTALARAARHAIGVWADPRTRLVLGAGGMLAAALPVRPDRVGQREARLFMAINNLPDALYAPAWTIMQCGAVGAVGVAAGAAYAAGDHKLAWRLTAAGVGTWALAKLVKQEIRRPRPASLLTGTRTRGQEASGLGYLSGHAGVATALCAASFPRLTTTARAAALGIVPVVGLSRVYVGAHLPLDIVGGASLGLAVEAAVVLVQRAIASR